MTDDLASEPEPGNGESQLIVARACFAGRPSPHGVKGELDVIHPYIRG